MPKIDRRKGAKRQRSTKLDIKAVGDDGVFEGYGSVFGVADAYNEIVVPGAFDETLKAHREAGTLPAMLWQHDSYAPIGKYTEMREDDKGLAVTGELNLDVDQGAAAHALLKQGAVHGLSIGYNLPDGMRYDDERGSWILEAIDLWEVSIVTFPANPAATVDDVKAFDNIKTIREVEAYIRDELGVSAKRAAGIVAKVREAINQRDAGLADLQRFKDAAKNLESALKL